MVYEDEGKNRDAHSSGGSSMNATTFEGGGRAMVPAAAALESGMTGASSPAANMIYGSYGVARPMAYQPLLPAVQQYSLPQYTTFAHPTGVTDGAIGASGLTAGQFSVVYPYSASGLFDPMVSMGYANRTYDHTNNLQSYEDASTSGTPGLPRMYIPQTRIPLGNQTHTFLRQPSNFGTSRSLASAANGPKMIPPMQSAVISGRLPEMKVGDKLVFGNVRLAHEYLRQPKLTPTMGNTGCPVTSGDAMYCIRKIYNALISVDAVWDKEVHSEDFTRFLDGGAWSDPKDLQAVTFHISGTLGGMHKGQQQGPPLRVPDLREPMPQDVAFTFHQRLHWTCFLLKHYKAHANRFMCLVAVEAHVARIWSVLSRERSFRSWWQSLTNEEKANHLYEDPYAGMTYRDYPMAHPLSDNTRSLVAAGLGQLIGLESHPSPLTSSTMTRGISDSSGLPSNRAAPNELNAKVSSAHAGSSANVLSQDDPQGLYFPEASYQELLDQISAETSFLSQDLGFELDEAELENILNDPTSEIWKGGAGFGETVKKGL